MKFQKSEKTKRAQATPGAFGNSQGAQGANGAQRQTLQTLLAKEFARGWHAASATQREMRNAESVNASKGKVKKQASIASASSIAAAQSASNARKAKTQCRVGNRERAKWEKALAQRNALGNT